VDGLDALKDTPILQDLSDDQRRAAAKHLRRIELRAGQRLWSDGDAASEVFVLAEGAILISRIGHDGNELIIKIYVDGEVLGKIDALAGAERTTDATAVEPSLCFALPVQQLLELMDRNPGLARRLLRDVSETSRGQLEAISEIVFHDIRERVALKLLELAKSNGEPTQDGTRITLHLSQSQLAGMVAASRANVNRALATFIARGDVTHRGGYFTIRHTENLEAVAVRQPGKDPDQLVEELRRA
jgi:CRP/FNR family transcriptional regulator, cyclic AMP receptor protein